MLRPIPTLDRITSQEKAQEFMFLFGGTLSPADLAYLDEILGTAWSGGFDRRWRR
jgi:hypothetical protein